MTGNRFERTGPWSLDPGCWLCLGYSFHNTQARPCLRVTLQSGLCAREMAQLCLKVKAVS